MATCRSPTNAATLASAAPLHRPSSCSRRTSRSWLRRRRKPSQPTASLTGAVSKTPSSGITAASRAGSTASGGRSPALADSSSHSLCKTKVASQLNAASRLAAALAHSARGATTPTSTQRAPSWRCAAALAQLSSKSRPFSSLCTWCDDVPPFAAPNNRWLGGGTLIGSPSRTARGRHATPRCARTTRRAPTSPTSPSTRGGS